MFARRFSSDRRAHVCIGTKKNSPFVTVSFDSVPKALGGTDVSAKELCYIRSVFERLDSLFYFTCDGARFSACFSPARIDWSLVGIKLEDGRLICDLDRDA